MTRSESNSIFFPLAFLSIGVAIVVPVVGLFFDMSKPTILWTYAGCITFAMTAYVVTRLLDESTPEENAAFQAALEKRRGQGQSVDQSDYMFDGSDNADIESGVYYREYYGSDSDDT